MEPVVLGRVAGPELLVAVGRRNDPRFCRADVGAIGTGGVELPDRQADRLAVGGLGGLHPRGRDVGLALLGGRLDRVGLVVERVLVAVDRAGDRDDSVPVGRVGGGLAGERGLERAQPGRCRSMNEAFAVRLPAGISAAGACGRVPRRRPAAGRTMTTTRSPRAATRRGGEQRPAPGLPAAGSGGGCGVDRASAVVSAATVVGRRRTAVRRRLTRLRARAAPRGASAGRAGRARSPRSSSQAVCAATRALRRVLDQQPLDPVRDPRVDVARRAGSARSRGASARAIGESTSANGRSPREQLVGHAAEPVEVGPRADVLRHRLLGRHVGRRADQHPGRGLERPRVELRGRLGDPEVGDLARARRRSRARSRA